MKLKFGFIIFLLVALLLSTNCEKKSETVKTNQLVVAVSILPQKYFVERIAGDKVSVVVLIPPGASPVTYEPSAVQMRKIVDAKIYFKVGHPNLAFEVNWFSRIREANKKMVVISLADSLDKVDKNKDPHIWVSPGMVKKQLNSLTDALIQQLPAEKAFFQKNRDDFIRDIEQTTEKINIVLKSIKIKKFLVFHPAWGYFADEFGLEQIAIEEHGKEADMKSLQEIIEHAKQENIKVIFVQEQFSQKEADLIANEINGKVVKIDPLAEDWLANLEKVASAFASALK